MTIIIDTIISENNGGSGIYIEGNVDVDIRKGKFNNNAENGVTLNTSNTSNISLGNIETLGNRKDGMKIEEYDEVIERSIKFAIETKDFNQEELKKLKTLLYDLKSNKNDKPAVQKIVKEICSIGKACIPTILGIIIKYLMGQ